MLLAVLLIALGIAAFADTRRAGEPPEVVANLPDGIDIELPGARGGGGGPGPGGPSDAPTEGPEVVPTPARAGSDRDPAIRLPNIPLTFSLAIAQVEGADVVLVYRAAVVARDSGQYELAAGLFDQVATVQGPLAPFARMRAAQMAALAEGPATAADRFASLIASGDTARLPASIRLVALTEAANALEAADRVDEALSALDQALQSTSNSFSQSQAYHAQARILLDADDPAWVEKAVSALTAQPAAVTARQALDLLDAEGEDDAYPEMVAAFAEYRGHRNDAAETRYRRLIDSNTLSAEEAATAYFYLGAIMERYYLREEALDEYENSLTLAPLGSLADDALYWRGRVLEELGRVSEAAVEYDLLLQRFPGSNWAEDGRLRAAVALGLAGEGAQATERLASIVTTAGPSTAAEAARWHEVLAERFGAPSAGDFAPGDRNPWSFATAFDLGGDWITEPLPDWAIREVPQPIEPDPAGVSAWLTATYGPQPAEGTRVLEDPTVTLAWRLVNVGEPGVARGLLAEVINERRQKPWELITLAYEAQKRGMHDSSMAAANAVVLRFGPLERMEMPKALLALSYPLPYLNEALAASNEWNVPVLLMMALVRQESAFHPTAGSSAGAFGLTQVIPPTGEAIARELGLEGWTFGDLAIPRVSMRFGAYYLGQQLRAFDGHMLAALAAYNAGPGNAARWLGVQPFGGPDGYVYAVDFTETKLYVALVPANYAAYRYIYGLTETPRLPHGER